MLPQYFNLVEAALSPVQGLKYAFLAAAQNGDLKKVQDLIEQGCSVNSKYQVKCTLTHTQSLTNMHGMFCVEHGIPPHSCTTTTLHAICIATVTCVPGCFTVSTKCTCLITSCHSSYRQSAWYPSLVFTCSSILLCCTAIWSWKFA